LVREAAVAISQLEASAKTVEKARAEKEKIDSIQRSFSAEKESNSETKLESFTSIKAGIHHENESVAERSMRRKKTNHQFCRTLE